MSSARILCAALLIAVVAGCQESDKKKWDEFWKRDSGDSLFSRSGEAKEVWTIECNEYRGPNFHETADRLAAALKRVAGLDPKAVWVEHDAERARVFYGEYKLRYVRAKVDGETQVKGDMVVELSDEIKRDLEFIRTLAVGDQYPFFSARVTERSPPDVGPPEWDLSSAKGVYTLHVGVTYNTPTLHNYKEAAIEWVRDLRQRGFQAYYYHDPEKAQTSICVGVFGDDALREMPDGTRRYSDAVTKLRETAEFRFNLENGHKISRVGENKEGKRAMMANESFLVKIPQKGQKVVSGR